MSDTKLIRKALAEVGVDRNFVVYNDVRNKYRRIKLSGVEVPASVEISLREKLNKVFGDRFITCQHVVSAYPIYTSVPARLGSLAVYLKK